MFVKTKLYYESTYIALRACYTFISKLTNNLKTIGDTAREFTSRTIIYTYPSYRSFFQI